MHVLWKIFGVSFELLAHNHVEVGAQVFSFGGWRSIKSLSETLSNNNSLVIGLASIILEGLEKFVFLVVILLNGGYNL
jgi:hypothetical protein